MRLSLGLRTLDVAEWLDVDEHYTDDLTEKRRLLSERPGDVVAHVPAALPAAQETLEMVRGWMSEHHPGLAEPNPGLHPVDAAGRMVQEDLCVMTAGSGAWRLAAASVCFPSRWSLREKIGTTLGHIHDPVPGYHDTIGSIVESSLDRLDVSRPLWRRNWSILDDPALFQPAPSPSQRRQPAALSALTLRVERQTLRRLPATGAVLFTIRTYRRGLEQVVSDPAAARDLVSSLRTCSPELAAYKGWTTMLGWLIDTLDAVTAAEAQPG